MHAVLLAHHGTAARGQHDAIPLRQGVDRRNLAIAKTGLAFLLEDERNVDAGARLDLVIAIDELHAQGARQLPANGRLAGSHRTNKKYVLRLSH